MASPNLEEHRDPANSSAVNPTLGHFLNLGPYPVKFKFVHKYIRLLKEEHLTMKANFVLDARTKIAVAAGSFRKTRGLAENGKLVSWVVQL
jgi:hypothetical protein